MWLSVLKRQSSLQIYMPLTGRGVGSSPASSKIFMRASFQLLAEGWWFYSNQISPRFFSTNKTGKVIK